jgi:hypothetical protein
MFFDLAQSLRSLTRSPITTAINQAHRMATHQLAAGGAVSSTHRSNPTDFLLPHDIDAIMLAMAIEAKLRRGSRRSNGGLRAVEMMPDGQAFVPGDYLLRLGNGDTDEGRRVVVRIIGDIRSRRRRQVSHAQ